MTEINVTQLLVACREKQSDAMQQLFPLVYDELHRIAQRQLRSAPMTKTLCATALVNEAYMKLAQDGANTLQNRAHFFAIAATAMRQILINYAEQKRTQKRGGEWLKVTFEQADSVAEQPLDTLLAINDALADVAQIDPALVQLVEFKFFAGMNETEIALVMNVTERTVRRNWVKAKALLAQALHPGE